MVRNSLCMFHAQPEARANLPRHDNEPRTSLTRLDSQRLPNYFCPVAGIATNLSATHKSNGYPPSQVTRLPARFTLAEVASLGNGVSHQPARTTRRRLHTNSLKAPACRSTR